MKLDRKVWKTFSNTQKAEYLAEHMTIDALRKRQMAIQDYQMSLYRINEQSSAAQREEDNVFNSLMIIQSALRIAKERKDADV